MSIPFDPAISLLVSSARGNNPRKGKSVSQRCSESKDSECLLQVGQVGPFYGVLKLMVIGHGVWQDGGCATQG